MFFLSKIKKIIPGFLFSWYHFFLALFAALIYRFPSKRLKVIGITGTKGKTTTVEMCVKILEEAGYKVCAVSSSRFKVGEKEWKNDLKMTMPGRFRIQKLLREGAKAGCEFAVLEVTSEGILQHRHRLVDFDVALITNLSPEHIERHGSFESYKEAKGKLFSSCKKIHIVNLDDKNADYFLGFEAQRKLAFSILQGSILKNERREIKVVKAENLRSFKKGLNFKVEGVEFNLNLMGEFNAYNALGAICVGISQGISLDVSKRALEKIKKVEGRMEIIIEHPFRIIVDYAHTPDSLEEVYKNISRFKSQESRLICVLGAAGGGRDRWKRPKMGEIAAEYCDFIILTNEDPYDEDPNQILLEIEKGIKNSHSYVLGFKKILDRREAVKEAMRLARQGDIIVITGKGSEPWMCVASGKKIPWDDREVVKEEFKRLKKSF